MPIIDRIRDRERIFGEVEPIEPIEEQERPERPEKPKLERLEQGKPEQEECCKKKLVEAVRESKQYGGPVITDDEANEILEIAKDDVDYAYKKFAWLIQKQGWRWTFIEQCAFGGESEGS